MEYCGGGSVSHLCEVMNQPLEEIDISYICREALKVKYYFLYPFLNNFIGTKISPCF